MKRSLTDNIQDLLVYNIHDCVVTARTFEQLHQEYLAGGERVRRLYEQHVTLGQIAAEMHSTGFQVNEENRQWMVWCHKQKIREAKQKVIKLVGIPGFTATPNQMRSIIFKRHEVGNMRRFGLEDPYDKRMWTKGGSIAVNQDALMLLMTQSYVPDELVKIIDAYWEVCSAVKARSTFLDSKLILHAIGKDGRMRPSWNTCGTDTGRWSCSAPNLMNLPQELRYMYEAGPGKVLIHGDKSQLELRVMEAVSGDQQLAKNLATGDVYTEDAKMIFGLPATLTRKEIKKAARDQGKVGHLGFQYEASTGTLFGQFLFLDRNIRYKQVQFIHDQLKKIYAGTVEYWGRERERVLAETYSETRLMQRRRYYPAEPAGTETSNYPIQGTAADIMNIEIINLWHALKKHVPSAKLLCQLHDAVDIEVEERHAGVVERILMDTMSAPEYEIEGRKRSFPLEVKRGKFWSEV